MFRAKIRGTYSTAITKLLMDSNFEIVQPSPPIRERFNLDQNAKPPDIDIHNRHNRQGIHVMGTSEALEALKSVFQEHMVDVVHRKQPFATNGIYKGILKKDKNQERFVSVDIGSAVGRLSKDETFKDPPASIMVQVQRKKLSAREPLLGTEITVPGEYAVLIPEAKVKVSLQIRDISKRMDLVALGRRLVPPSGWGIIWRTAAKNQPRELLESEISRLAETREEIFKRFKEETAPARLWGNQYYMNVEFPTLSKARLDEARAGAAPTIPGHHYYKACGQAISKALDMAESMLENGVSREEVGRLFRQIIEAEYPAEGSCISIEHVKPDGKVFHLGNARVDKCSNRELWYSRTFKDKGVYDGLGTPKEPGDQAVTEAEVGGWHYITRYFSKDDRYKGAYVNLHTPLELYPKWIRYVDLEVDACVLPDGTVKVVDEGELDDAVAHGFIGDKLAALAKDTLSKILKNLKHISVSRNPAGEE